MEFMDKRKRLVLLAIAKEGLAGISLDALNSTLSVVMSRDTLIKTIEELYFSQYISLVRDGNEIRYVATKKVRNAMINLELYQFRLSKYLEELKKLSESSGGDKGKAPDANELLQKGLKVIAMAYLSLLSEEPEFTIPEFSEVVQVVYSEVLSKLLPFVERERSSEELDKLLELVSKYRGEREAEALRLLMKKTVDNA